jgi:hypothetical protein
MTSEGLGEVFTGDSADMCAVKFPLVSMGGRADHQVAQTGSEDPHRRERNLKLKKTKSINRSGFCPNVAVSRVETLYYVFPWNFKVYLIM